VRFLRFTSSPTGQLGDAAIDDFEVITAPSSEPTFQPTRPSIAPTHAPTKIPTPAPTPVPTTSPPPTDVPTELPIPSPTTSPTLFVITRKEVSATDVPFVLGALGMLVLVIGCGCEYMRRHDRAVRKTASARARAEVEAHRRKVAGGEYDVSWRGSGNDASAQRRQPRPKGSRKGSPQRSPLDPRSADKGVELDIEAMADHFDADGDHAAPCRPPLKSLLPLPPGGLLLPKKALTAREKADEFMAAEEARHRALIGGVLSPLNPTPSKESCTRSLPFLTSPLHVCVCVCVRAFSLFSFFFFFPSEHPAFRREEARLSIPAAKALADSQRLRMSMSKDSAVHRARERRASRQVSAGATWRAHCLHGHLARTLSCTERREGHAFNLRSSWCKILLLSNSAL